LHTTTNILAVPALAAKCEAPFSPANETALATARCCTSDVTLEEFKSLCGKMDASDPSATTVDEYLGGTASFRTDLYATCATVVSHAESIALIGDLKFTPELKTYTPTSPDMPSYDEVRAKLIQEYVDAGVNADRVWPQSFNLPDIQYWIANYPDTFGPQAVYLDNQYCDGTLADCPQTADFGSWYASGVRYYAPPVHMLASARAGDANYAATELATAAKDAGLQLITWTVERSGPLVLGDTGFYFGTSSNYTDNDGDVFEYIHTLYSQAGVVGIFSDWPATTTFYANCLITVDDDAWYKRDDPSKNCDWVAGKPTTRCRAKANDKSFAMTACAYTCAPYASSSD